MKEKICRQCQLSLPATQEYFYTKKANGKVYVRGICKECAKNEQITYYDKKRGRILDKKAEQYRSKTLQNSIYVLN